jgi:Holliday junction resolvasome RuvABC endonuclease subunit
MTASKQTAAVLTQPPQSMVEFYACARTHTQEDLPPRVSETSAAGRTAFLALDLGTTTGWALRQQDGTITSGTQWFGSSRYEGGGMRYLRFKRWLGELLSTTPVLGAVYFEEVRRHQGVDAAHVYGGLLAHLAAWCEARRLPYQGVPVGTIKRHATGRGTASKDEVIAAMRGRGYAPRDDNEADALALLHWVLDQEVRG